jgi:RHH-type rel operon transcriptional repressor/antitoxin RelB
MLTIRLDGGTEQRLNYLAAQTHRTKSFYVKQELLEYLDDLEDFYLAKQELEDIKSERSDIVSWENIKSEAKL